MTPRFPQLATWAPFQWLQFRDLTLIPNAMEFQYTMAREAVAEILMERELEQRALDNSESGAISADEEGSEDEKEQD